MVLFQLPAGCNNVELNLSFKGYSMPPAAKNLFEKRFLDLQKLFILDPSGLFFNFVCFHVSSGLTSKFLIPDLIEHVQDSFFEGFIRLEPD